MKYIHKICFAMLVLIILMASSSWWRHNGYGYEYFGNGGSGNNLISNGSFENGKDITQKIKSEGNNQIVVLENPGASSYVLQQSYTPNTQTYYLLRLLVEPSEHYILCFWYCCEGGTDLEETLLKLEIKDKNHRNHVIQGNTVVKEKAQVDGRQWSSIQFHFQVPPNLLDNALYLYLGYNMTSGTRFYTDVSLKKYLTDAPKFGITDGLQVFLDGARTEPGDQVWKDISEKGHDFIWDNKPNYQSEGYYQTYANSLQGPSGRELVADNNNFSLGMHLSVTETVQKPVSLKEQNLLVNYRELVRIPGNNQIALRVWLPLYYGRILVDIADQRYETNKDVVTYNNNVYFFLYNGTELNIYLNNALISTIVPKIKMHFTAQPIVINYNKNMRAHLHNVIFYNRVLNCDEIKRIIKYLTTAGGGQTIIQKWLKAPRVPETLETPAKKIEPTTSGDCPAVALKNGEYWIHIPTGGKLHKILGYCGYKSYGREQANAAKIYKLNFPSCRVPDILTIPPRHPSFPLCPYVVNDGNNPCTNGDCPNVNWTEKDPTKMNLTEKCKRGINNYCDKHSEYDPMCKCWKLPYRNRPDCIKYRRQFLNPRDYSCSINNFNIEEHPDMSKYIRKDRIPCYACDLTA